MKNYSTLLPVAATVLQALIVPANLLAEPALAGQDLPMGPLCIGWASADITPEQPVVIRGASRARVSEGALDPVTATALAIQSAPQGKTADMVVLVSCDLLVITDTLRDRVREMLKESAAGNRREQRSPQRHTHTHTAPSTFTDPPMAEKLARFGLDVPVAWSAWGMDLGVMSAPDYLEFAAERIARAVEHAWKSREPGGMSFGLGHAVVGRNRLAVYADGHSKMYGKTDQPDFSHVEGYEDHSVNLLYTWSAHRKLTGVVVNLACPSQAGWGSRVSADFWHETRNELRSRLGEDLFVLTQCSAAGDLAPRAGRNSSTGRSN